MNFCCAPNCKNKNSKNSDLTFHRFPRNEVLKNKWLEAINKPSNYVNKGSVLCSAHFESNCYGGMVSSKWLKGDSVPTIFNFNQIQPENNSDKVEITYGEPIARELETFNKMDVHSEMEVDEMSQEISILKPNKVVDLDILRTTKKLSKSKRKQILISRDVWDKIKASGSTEIIQNIIFDSSAVSKKLLTTSKTLELSSTCSKPSTGTVIELSDESSETNCVIVQQDTNIVDDAKTTNNLQDKPNCNLRTDKESTIAPHIIEVLDDQKNHSDLRKKNLKRGRPPNKKLQNNICQQAGIESLLKRRNACIQVCPSSTDIASQTDMYDEGSLPFKNRILNTTIDVLQKRLSKLEAKVKAQSGALWMKNKKLALLKEQKKELCQKLNEKSMEVVGTALKEVLHEYFNDSASPEDAVNKSKQLCLHANIYFKKK